MNSGTFTLDPQLARDTVPAGDLALSRVLLNADANYPWLILVPRRPGLVELIDLTDADRAALTEEIAAVSHALRGITACDKLNVAALGNVVAQLHVHIIARFRSDAAWPNPVWNAAPRLTYAAEKQSVLLAALRGKLALR